MWIGPTPPPNNSEPLFSLGYTSLGNFVLGIPSPYSLYDHLIWSSSITPTTDPFVSSMASQIPIRTMVSLAAIQPTITIGTVYFPIGYLNPLSTYMVVTPTPLSGKNVPPPIPLHGGQPPPPYVPLISVEPM